jgi:hypothetical protein
MAGPYTIEKENDKKPVEEMNKGPIINKKIIGFCNDCIERSSQAVNIRIDAF